MARKILLADDSVTAQNMGRKILADAGYEVVTVNNGSAALKRINEGKPDLILLDVYMPGYSGLEVCQRLKEAQETARIPILLTVGKLEPFKPEEAKRVRAEGFIVKPFEASELLAALTKLEDKIVPRPEPSKPGRFARANAAIEESRYDKTMAVEEDAGWKNRIAFPSKKKKAAPDESGDDAAIYNPVNKDLRTTVDHKPASVPHAQEDARVDLGALAPEGLPKDVTPEEIAALAAAAAQMKGKLAESKSEEPAPEMPVSAPIESKPFDPEATAEIRVTTDEIKLAEAKLAEAQAAHTTVDEKPAAKAEPEPAKEVEAPAAMLAEQKPEEAPAEQPAEVAREVAPEPVAEAAHVPVEAPLPIPEPTPVVAHPGSGNGTGSHAASEQPAFEPAMAVAAGAGFSTPSRWTAVAVALAPEEAGISLEEEMQKAHAAYAAAEVAQAAAAAAPKAEGAVTVEPAPMVEAISPVEAVTPELLGAPAVAPEIEPAVPEISAPAVKEFETVASAHVESELVPPIVAAEPESAPAHAEAQAELEKLEAAETKTEQAPVVEAAPEASLPESVQEEISVLSAEAKSGDLKPEETKAEEPKADEPAPVAAAAIEEQPKADDDKSEINAPTAAHEVRAAQVSASQPSAEDEPSASNAAASAKGAAEPDLAETTAAAWASWRRIRETDSKGKGKGKSKKRHDDSEDEAAMAVAAGAEKSPEDAGKSPGEGDEIANIVDGVLADLRPKIVEEISKKLGKKK